MVTRGFRNVLLFPSGIQRHPSNGALLNRPGEPWSTLTKGIFPAEEEAMAAAPLLYLRRSVCHALLTGLLAVALLGGCATDSERTPIDISLLPLPDRELLVSGLGPCTAEADRHVRLNKTAPVAILVHGFLGSPSRMRPLAQELSFRGLQTICFSYDDRDSLMHSSGELARAIDALAAELVAPQITVIGHSHGGLIARKALVAERPDPLGASQARLHLVTVATPFSGTALARWCAYTPARILTLGLGDLVCRLISGKKWYEITYASEFIRQPGKLVSMVQDHLLIMTDEASSCRTFDAQGYCSRADYVISLPEQHFPPVEDGPRVTPVQVKAGHLEIIGELGGGAGKLLTVLQQRGLLAPAASSPQDAPGSALAHQRKP